MKEGVYVTYEHSYLMESGKAISQSPYRWEIVEVDFVNRWFKVGGLGGGDVGPMLVRFDEGFPLVWIPTDKKSISWAESAPENGILSTQFGEINVLVVTWKDFTWTVKSYFDANTGILLRHEYGGARHVLGDDFQIGSIYQIRDTNVKLG